MSDYGYRNKEEDPKESRRLAQIEDEKRAMAEAAKKKSDADLHNRVVQQDINRFQMDLEREKRALELIERNNTAAENRMRLSTKETNTLSTSSTKRTVQEEERKVSEISHKLDETHAAEHTLEDELARHNRDLASGKRTLEQETSKIHTLGNDADQAKRDKKRAEEEAARAKATIAGIEQKIQRLKDTLIKPEYH